MGTSSALKWTSGDPEICLLPLRFSKNESKQNFSILVSSSLEAKDIFSALARDGLKRILPGTITCYVNSVKEHWIKITFAEISPKIPDCLLDHCLCQRQM